MLAKDALRFMVSSVGVKNPDPEEILNVLNDAGDFLLSSYPWRCLQRIATLDIRAQISVTNATWTPGSLTLTKTGAFASYTLLYGDRVTIDGGTGVSLGSYEIESKTDNTLVLRASIGSSSATDVSATLHLTGLALPSDFRGFIPGTPTATPSYVNSFQPTDLSEVLRWRALNTTGTNAAYVGAVVWAPSANDGIMIPRLEIAPEVPAGHAGAFVIHYRAGWVTIVSQEQEFHLPRFLYPSFREVLRHFMRGTFESDEGTCDQRLAGFTEGSLFAQAMEADANFQIDFGRPHATAIQAAMSRGPLQDFEILDPSNG